MMVPVVTFADLAVQNLNPGTTVPVGTLLTFSVTGASSSTPTYYVSDTYAGSSVDNTKISSQGTFTWTPLIQDIGAHTLRVSSYDTAGVSLSVSQDVTVVPKFRISILSLSPGAAVNPGQVVTFTASSSGFASPTFSATDSFTGGTPVFTAINTQSGAFSWTPTSSDIGTHIITVTAQDSSSNNRSITQQITVAAASGTATPLTTTGPLPGSPAPTVVTTPVVATPVATVTAAAPAYYFTSYLKLGSTGDEVTALQNVLIRGGYLSGAATGYFGSLTASALMKYQTAHGLDALGVVGPATRVVLNAGTGTGVSTTVSAPTTTTVSTSNSGNASARLRIIQQLLVQFQQMQALLIQLQAVND